MQKIYYNFCEKAKSKKGGIYNIYMDYYNKLKSLIYKKGFKLQDIACNLGLDRASFTRKLKIGRFTVSELQKLIIIFGRNEILDIFFS